MSSIRPLPPVCAACRVLYGLGVVGQEVVDANPTPRHVNCEHFWRLLPVTTVAPKPRDLWVG